MARQKETRRHDRVQRRSAAVKIDRAIVALCAARKAIGQVAPPKKRTARQLYRAAFVDDSRGAFACRGLPLPRRQRHRQCAGWSKRTCCACRRRSRQSRRRRSRARRARRARQSRRRRMESLHGLIYHGQKAVHGLASSASPRTLARIRGQSTTSRSGAKHRTYLCRNSCVHAAHENARRHLAARCARHCHGTRRHGRSIRKVACAAR